MQGRVADRLVVAGTKPGAPARVGEILEVIAGHGPDRYRVRWNDGRETVFSPGADTTVDSKARIEAEWAETVAATHARCAAWRRGITAGVGHEASLAQAARGA